MVRRLENNSVGRPDRLVTWVAVDVDKAVEAAVVAVPELCSGRGELGSGQPSRSATDGVAQGAARRH